MSLRCEPGVGWLHIGKVRKTSLAHRLISIDLCEVRLVHGTGTCVLHFDTAGRSELPLNAEAPLHEVRCVKLAIGNRSDRDR